MTNATTIHKPTVIKLPLLLRNYPLTLLGVSCCAASVALILQPQPTSMSQTAMYTVDEEEQMQQVSMVPAFAADLLVVSWHAMRPCPHAV